MNSEYWVRAFEEIQAWEKRKPSFLANITHVVTDKVGHAVSLAIPDRIEDAIIQAIAQALKGIAKVTDEALGREGIRERVRNESQQHGDDLQGADEAARFYWNCGVAEAGVEGAGTGVAGAVGLIADIPLLFGILIHTVQRIGLCYGFNPDSEAERAFVLKVLNCSTADDVKARVEMLAVAKELEQAVSEKMIQNVARNVGFRLARRKAAQLVPLAGGAIGLVFNSMFLNEVGEAAFMMYRKRYIDLCTKPSSAKAASA